MTEGRPRFESPPKIDNSELPPLEPGSRAPNRLTFGVLGVRVDAIQIPDVIGLMGRWISARSACHFIAFTGMHGITETRYDPSFKQILNSADLIVADGMPVVWLGRWHGHTMRRRVYGPELMEIFCRETGPLYQHYFYGGSPGVADRLAEVSRQRYGVRTVGTYSPPSSDRTDLGRSRRGIRFRRRDKETGSGLGAGEGARMALPPHSRAAPALATLPRQRTSISVERLSGAFEPQEIQVTLPRSKDVELSQPRYNRSSRFVFLFPRLTHRHSL